MQIALYRKYRPQTFAEVVGQEPIRLALQNQIASGHVGHAYLLAGPKGTGKTTVARIIAKAVNCLDPKNGAPCNDCVNCKAADAGSFLDLIEIDAASNNGVENVRELVANIYLAPSQGKYKVYIVDEAHMLSKPAFNALLKTLEEPPSHVIFILATTEPDKLLPTIVSRCQRFDFRPVTNQQMIGQLTMVADSESVKISPDVIALIAEQSGGGVRDGLSLLERVMALGNDVTVESLRQWFGWVTMDEVAGLMNQIVAGQTKEVLARVDEYVYGGIDMLRLSAMWLQTLRAILAAQLGNLPILGLADSTKASIEALAKRLTREDLAWWLAEAMVLPREIKGAVVPVVPVELMIVRAAARFGADEQPMAKGSNTGDQVLASKAADTVEEPAEAPAVSLAQKGPSQPFEWSKFVGEVRKVKPTFAGTLDTAVWELHDGELQIKFARKFHYEVAIQSANRLLLNQTLENGGWDLKLDLAIDEQAALAHAEVDPAMVGEIFGEA